jgi:hypothetical protein
MEVDIRALSTPKKGLPYPLCDFRDGIKVMEKKGEKGKAIPVTGRGGP